VVVVAMTEKGTFEKRPDVTLLAADLKAAMRRMPSAVSLITTRDPVDEHPAGLVASAVIPVSMQPPSMLVSVNRAGSTHAAISRAGRYCINLLTTAQTELVSRFTSQDLRDLRFTSELWHYDGEIPFLPTACASIFCETIGTLVVGTHELFIGEVVQVQAGSSASSDPLGWIEGGFARLDRFR
jgi:flavin reductase (DIM6/NTAB) family NADH-FMN oxidoreductase RutF